MRVVGLLLVLLSLPAVIFWLKGNATRFRHAAFAVGFLPFVIAAFNLDASLVNWAMWPGHTKGIIVTFLDSIALAVLIANRRKLGWPAFLSLFILYLVAAVISILFADVALSSAFYAFQIARMILVFVAVVALMQYEGSAVWLCYGLAGATILQAAYSIFQKLQGVAQATGTLSHQNMLGMMLHFSTLPLIALILAGNRNPLVLIGSLAGLLAAALTASRATIGFLSIGIAVLVCLSLVRKATLIKWRALGLGIFAAAIVIPLSLSALAERSEADKISGDEERAAFERAALMMWEDNPMGVGANEYVVTANVGGYSDAAGVVAVRGSRAAHVHNIYLLHAAEMGWLGLVAFILLVFGAFLRGITFALRRGDDPRGDLVLGASVALLVMAMHGYLEWIIVTTSPQYLIAITAGIIAGAYLVPERRPEAKVAKRADIVERVMR